MIRLALIDGTDAFHGRAFPGFINHVDKSVFKKEGWPFYENVLGRRATITHVWGENAKATKALAAAAGIEHVLKKPTDAIGQVDGAMLVDNLKMTHQRHAPAFIKAGVPTFIDKPLSPRWQQAQSIVKLAEKSGTPIMSTSALRFATEIADRNALADLVGEVVTCSAAGTNELFFYGIHPITLMLTVMGARVKSVVNVGQRGRSIVRLRLTDGRQAVLFVYEKDMAYTLEVTVHGTKGHVRIAARDAQGFYGNMLAEFVTMVETGRPPIPYDETLNVIRALLLAKRSVRDHKEHTL